MTDTDAMYHYAHEIAKREARIRELEAEVAALRKELEQERKAIFVWQGHRDVERERAEKAEKELAEALRLIEKMQAVVDAAVSVKRCYDNSGDRLDNGEGRDAALALGDAEEEMFEAVDRLPTPPSIGETK